MSDPIPIDFSKIRLPAFKAGRILPIVLIAFVLLIVLTSWFMVGPESVGVVLRLGKYSHEAGPGLHFKLPLGLDRVHMVEVQRQLKLEFGFRTVEAGINTRYDPRNFAMESLKRSEDHTC